MPFCRKYLFVSPSNPRPLWLAKHSSDLKIVYIWLQPCSGEISIIIVVNFPLRFGVKKKNFPLMFGVGPQIFSSVCFDGRQVFPRPPFYPRCSSFSGEHWHWVSGSALTQFHKLKANSPLLVEDPQFLGSRFPRRVLPLGQHGLTKYLATGFRLIVLFFFCPWKSSLIFLWSQQFV